MKNKIISALVSVLMLFTCIPYNSYAYGRYTTDRERAEYEAKVGDSILASDVVLTPEPYAASIEAEDIPSTGREILSDEDTSGGKYIRFNNTVNITNIAGYDPYMSFSVKCSKRSSYYVWARVYATDNGSDSVWTAVDAEDYKPIYYNGPYLEWRWTVIASPVLEAGIHNIHIIPREKNVMIDKIIVSSKSSFTPEGKGEIPDAVTQKVVYPEPDFYPPSGHPRVYFRADDIPTIKSNMTNSENAAYYEKYKFYAGISPDRYKHNGSVDSSEIETITCKAFAYAIEADKKSGTEAVDMALSLGESIAFDSMTTYNQRASLGKYMTVCGFVYDWCYDLLTDDQKDALYEYTIAAAKRAEIGYPPTKLGSVFTHGVEDQLQVNLIIPGVAMYDEYPDIYLNSAGRLFKEFIEAKEFLASGKVYPQGTHYMGFRLKYDLLCMYIFDRMGYPDIYGSGYSEQMISYLYNRRPDGGLLYDGDAWEKKTNGYISLGQKVYFLAANYFKNPYFKYEYLRDTSSSGITPVEFLCFNDPSVGVKSPDDLPLSRYLPGYRGEMLCRTDWDDGKDANTVVASMKINEYNLAEHQHYDSGSFQLYYKGYLATDSGYYQAAVHETLPLPVQNDGNTNCDSLYANQYQRRTIAHNCITVYDPGEVFYDTTRSYTLENDGGQKAPTKWSTSSGLSYFLDENNGYHVGKVLGHEIGEDEVKPDYTYLKGDLSNAYSSKISDYERSFMFLNLKNDENPAALIVFDRVKTSNPEFKKTWLLHTLEEPQTTGSRTVASDTRSGYGGKLTLDTLLPAADNLSIDKDGGYDTATMSGAKVGDTVYWAAINAGDRNEAGGWRLEVSPKNASDTDYFLNVLQVGEGEPLDVSLIETDTHAGAVIADRVTVFAKDKNRTKENVAFSFGGSGTYKITVADLNEGTWQVYANGEYVKDVCVDKDGGVASFEGACASYELKFKSEDGEKIFTSESMTSSNSPLIRVDGEYIYSDAKPYIKNGRVMVPLRTVSNALGANTEWNEADRSATVTKDERQIYIKANDSKAYVNGYEEALDSSAEIKNDRIFVPLRFISEIFNSDVKWESTLRCVILKKSTAYLYAYTGKTELLSGIPVSKVTYSDWNADEIGENTLDGDLSTLWSAQGTYHWIMYDFGTVTPVSGFKIIWNKGDQRQEIYNVEVSEDGENFKKIIDTKAEGKAALAYEDNKFGETMNVRYVRINMFGNTKTDWNGIIETVFY